MKKTNNTIDRTLKRLAEIPKDKYMHVCISSALTAVFGLFLPFVPLLAVMTIIYLYKGVRDAQGRGCAEWGDLIADYIGFLIGVI